jgi:hypothetical protein
MTIRNTEEADMNAIVASPDKPLVAAAPAPASEAGSMLNIIAAAAENPNTDVAKLEALLRMQREVLADQAKAAFARALWRLKTDLPQISKEGTIDLGVKGSIKFARWEDMAKVIEPLMNREGFTLSFDTEYREGGGAVIVGELMHVDGHSRTARFSLPLDSGPGRNNLQAAGSTLSYGKRYCVEMLLNIVRKGEDDDGKAGGTKFISDKQVAELKDMFDRSATQPRPFLERFFEVHEIHELEAAQFTPCHGFLTQKLDALARKANPQ